MPGHRGVGVFADRRFMWRLNVECRVANRVLVPIAEFPAATREALYEGAAKVDWSRWFKVDATIAIDASSHKSQQTHTAFMAQVVKDGICDRFREITGRRPSVNRVAPDVRINARVDRDRCVLSLDASGDRLHRRGYRIATGEAPIKETLAAGILALSEWTPDKILVDPMCGSGTFLIEGAMMAAGIPPGLNRSRGQGFGFMNWLGHDVDGFNAYIDGLERSTGRVREGQFYGTDSDLRVLDKLMRNAKRAGISEGIKTGAVDIRDFRKPDSMPGGDAVHLVSNPPYGERMGDDRLGEFYEEIGNLLKREFAGSKATLIVGDDSPHRSIGLKPDSSRRLRNGAIPCRLLQLDVFPPRKPQRDD
jgi:23S rRNA (guanine2445-N2)-methyltransferase / 23S rRNA (guanine2069-N7)-methyltransferase